MFWIKMLGVFTGACTLFAIVLMFTSARMWAIVPFLFAIILVAVYVRMVTEYNAEVKADSTDLE